MGRGASILLSYGDTLLWATLDGGRKPRVRSMERLPADAFDPDDGLVQRIETAAHACTDLGKRTYVLSDDVFATSLDFDARSIRGLSADETRNALALEAQMHSGIGADEAVIAWQPLLATGSNRRFSLQQVPKTDLAEIDACLRERGSRLASISHPAGMPTSLSPIGAAFKRLERWPDLIARVAAGVGASDRASDAVEVEFNRDTTGDDESLADDRVTEKLTATPIGDSGSPTGADSPDLHVSLDDDAALRGWIESWADAFISQHSALAIRPPKAPIGTGPRIAAAAGLAIAVIAGAYLDHRRLANARADIGKELVAARAPIDALSRVRSETSRMRVQLSELTAPIPRAPAPPKSGWRSDTAARLLEATAKRRPRGVMIDSISIGWKGGAITGCSIERESIDAFGDAISDHFADSNLLIVPTARRLIEDGERAGLFEFVLDVTVRSPNAAADIDKTEKSDSGPSQDPRTRSGDTTPRGDQP